MNQQLYSLRSIGPTVELQMIDIDNWPVGGGVSFISSRSVTIGCDAPIVAAISVAAGFSSSLVSNFISESPDDPVGKWIHKNNIEGISRSGNSTPTIIGIDLAHKRLRTYLVPKRIDLAGKIDLGSTIFDYTYIDWYPEVRHWTSVAALSTAASNTRIWLNLARHSSDESIASLRGGDFEIIQLSVVGGRKAATALSARLFEITGTDKVVTTLGSQGSLLFDRSAGLISEVVPIPVGEGRSGAGAMFIGGFLVSRMQGCGWEIAHQNATALASAFVRREGKPLMPTLDLA